MIRIGVFSDSHGDLTGLREALSHAGNLDLVLHCGDYFEDIVKSMDGSETPYNGVSGNVDMVKRAPNELEIEVSGVKLYMTHGHLYDVKYSLNRLYYRSIEVGADVCLFGHTHIATVVQHEGLVMMNPGSVARPKGGKTRSYGLVEIEGKIPNCRTIYF